MSQTREVIRDGEVYEETCLELKRRKNVRGFYILEFEDRYGQRCTLQESSLATEGAVWFGVNNTGPFLPGPGGERNEEVNARMHLTQKQVEQLLPALQHFAETGYLPRPEEDT